MSFGCSRRAVLIERRGRLVGLHLRHLRHSECIGESEQAGCILAASPSARRFLKAMLLLMKLNLWFAGGLVIRCNYRGA